MRINFAVGFAVAVLAGIASANSPAVKVPGASSILDLSENDPVSWARPNVIASPEYPVGAVAKKISGYVDIDILVIEVGTVGEIRSVTSTPKNEEFEDAVRKVIKLWRFRAPMSNCRPYETVGNVRVWFDMKGDEGVISVSNRVPPVEVPNDPSPKIVSHNADEIHRAVEYPLRGRYGDAETNVHIKFIVEPKTGRITSIDVMHVLASRPGFENDFAEVSRAAVAQFKIEPILDRETPVAVCVPFTFRFITPEKRKRR